jgi:hypothetical protein
MIDLFFLDEEAMCAFKDFINILFLQNEDRPIYGNARNELLMSGL